ncbi:hypothetical protein KC324_g18 [Hortaea werneckii]|nr:hypothetical protein KC324_g18 [Hortaea werneckii]
MLRGRSSNLPSLNLLPFFSTLLASVVAGPTRWVVRACLALHHRSWTTLGNFLGGSRNGNLEKRGRRGGRNLSHVYVILHCLVPLLSSCLHSATSTQEPTLKNQHSRTNTQEPAHSDQRPANSTPRPAFSTQQSASSIQHPESDEQLPSLPCSPGIVVW